MLLVRTNMGRRVCLVLSGRIHHSLGLPHVPRVILASSAGSGQPSAVRAHKGLTLIQARSSAVCVPWVHGGLVYCMESCSVQDVVLGNIPPFWACQPLHCVNCVLLAVSRLKPRVGRFPIVGAVLLVFIPSLGLVLALPVCLVHTVLGANLPVHYVYKENISFIRVSPRATIVLSGLYLILARVSVQRVSMAPILLLQVPP